MQLRSIYSIAAAALAMSVATSAHAQSLEGDSLGFDDEHVSHSNVRFSFQAGANIAGWTQSGGAINNTINQKTGYNLAGFVDLPFSPKMGLRTGLSFMKLVTDLKGSFLNVTYENNLRVSQCYFGVPVLLTYSLLKNVKVYAGPEIAKLTSATRRLTTDNGNFINIKDNLNTANWWGWTGAEYAIPLKRSHNALTLGASFRFQLNDLIKNDENNSYSSLKNNMATFTVGYRF